MIITLTLVPGELSSGADSQDDTSHKNAISFWATFYVWSRACITSIAQPLKVKVIHSIPEPLEFWKGDVGPSMMKLLNPDMSLMM
jgi:hypothetical protein